MTLDRRILPGAGFAVWGIVAFAEIVRAVERPTSTPAVVVVCVALAVFALAFVTIVRVEHLGIRERAAAVGVQSIAALAIVAQGRGGFAPALLVVIAGQAPIALPLVVALGCVAVQTIALTVIATLRWDEIGALLTSGSWFGFQLFAFGASHLAERERAARRELARVHAELLATHAMLADSARVAERLRISRELHDALGHHLAALSLQLEVARNVVDGRAAEPVEAAHAIAKQLLAELREVVGAMRSDEPLDLARALRLLVAGVPHPEVHLALPPQLRGRRRVARARMLFRCVQEALTNTIRHARAQNIWIELTNDGGRLAIEARDDGCGVEMMKPGAGLSGLRERVEGIGGGVEIESSSGNGFRLRRLRACAEPVVIDVVLVDDQTLVRQGIRSLLALASDIRVVGEAADGDQALSMIVAMPAAVVLLDVKTSTCRPSSSSRTRICIEPSARVETALSASIVRPDADRSAAAAVLSRVSSVPVSDDRLL